MVRTMVKYRYWDNLNSCPRTGPCPFALASPPPIPPPLSVLHLFYTPFATSSPTLLHLVEVWSGICDMARPFPCSHQIARNTVFFLLQRSSGGFCRISKPPLSSFPMILYPCLRCTDWPTYSRPDMGAIRQIGPSPRLRRLFFSKSQIGYQRMNSSLTLLTGIGPITSRSYHGTP